MRQTSDGGTLTVPDVGLLGKAGAGKDTVAAYLVERFGYERRAFADAMKLDIFATLFGNDAYYGHTIPEILARMNELKAEPPIRGLLQHYGEAQKFLHGEDYWSDRALAYLADKQPVVVADVRTRQEVAYLTKRGLVLIRVVRPGHDNGLTDEQRAHWTETELDDFVTNYTIVNDGDLAQLHRAVQQLWFNFF